MSLILLDSPVFNVEISEAVCYFVIFKKKKFFFGKVKSLLPVPPLASDVEKKNFSKSLPRSGYWQQCEKEIISQLHFVRRNGEK